MPSSGIWGRVGLVRTDVSEKRVASIFRVEKSASEKSVSSWPTNYRESFTFFLFFDYFVGHLMALSVSRIYGYGFRE
jgi:hypothetical protein